MIRALVALFLLAGQASAQTCESNCTTTEGQQVQVAAETLATPATYALAINGGLVLVADSGAIYVDAQLVGSVWLESGYIVYGFLEGLGAGQYAFWLEARDGAGTVVATWANDLAVVAAPADVTPPTVPPPTIRRSGRSVNVTITGWATDAESGLQSLAIALDGKTLVTCGNSPCTVQTKARSGTVTVTAKDKAGNVATASAAVR